MSKTPYFDLAAGFFLVSNTFESNFEQKVTCTLSVSVPYQMVHGIQPSLVHL